MNNKAERKDIIPFMEKQRNGSSPQGNKDLRYMTMYLGIDYACVDCDIKDLKAEYDSQYNRRYLHLKSDISKKMTIPEIESTIEVDLEPLADEIRKLQRQAAEMKATYDGAIAVSDSIKTELFQQKDLEKLPQ